MLRYRSCQFDKFTRAQKFQCAVAFSVDAQSHLYVQSDFIETLSRRLRYGKSICATLRFMYCSLTHQIWHAERWLKKRPLTERNCDSRRDVSAWQSHRSLLRTEYDSKSCWRHPQRWPPRNTPGCTPWCRCPTSPRIWTPADPPCDGIPVGVFLKIFENQRSRRTKAKFLLHCFVEIFSCAHKNNFLLKITFWSSVSRITVGISAFLPKRMHFLKCALHR